MSQNWYSIIDRPIMALNITSSDDNNVRHKRRRSETDSRIKEQLSIDDVKELLNHVNEDKCALLKWLSNEKSTEGKKCLRDTVQSFGEAINKISSAYLGLLQLDTFAVSCNDALLRACDSINKASKSIDNIVNSVSNTSVRNSYANVASSGSKVFVNRGKPLSVHNCKRIIIGPKSDSLSDFSSSSATKLKFSEIINPVEIGLKANRVSAFANNSVVIEADSIDEDRLRSLPAFVESGLEIKPETKLNPRIIIRDVPVSLDSGQIKQFLLQQNLTNATADDVKIVYLYPANGRTTRSVVIETTPKNRKTLFAVGKIYMGMTSCRFNDHLTVLQCFNCLKFGHIASKCVNTSHCAHCSGFHASTSCSKTATPSCFNCKEAKYPESAHSGFDKLRCPILRTRLQNKAKLIDYGS